MTPISEVNFSRLYPGAGQRGFTLLELMVVLSIIIIATAIVIPSITGTESNLLTAQVRQTKAALNYARRIAIVEGAPQVAIYSQVDSEDPEALKLRKKEALMSTIPLPENFDVEVTFQADINEEPEQLESIEVTFFPQGGSTGGIISFSLDELKAYIYVDPITGRVSAYYSSEEFEEAFL